MVSTLNAGLYSVLAQYAGDGNFGASTSADGSLSVNPANTSPSNPVYGARAAFTVTVAAQSPGAGTPTGTVHLLDNGTDIGSASLDVNGQAAFTNSSLSLGSHNLSTHYDGDSNFLPGKSSVLVLTVIPSNSTTSVTSSTNPTRFGQAVTLTGTVSPVTGYSGTPTGTLTFYADGTSLGSATLDNNGVATLTVSTLAAGNRSITATYSGDATFGSSTSAALTQTVNPADTTVSIGTGALVNGVASFSTLGLSVGLHHISASYAGGSNYNASDATALDVTIN